MNSFITFGKWNARIVHEYNDTNIVLPQNRGVLYYDFFYYLYPIVLSFIKFRFSKYSLPCFLGRKCDWFIRSSLTSNICIEISYLGC